MEKITLQIATFLAKQLDKLKVKSPIVFLGVQATLLMLAGAFVQGTFHIDTPEFLAKWVNLNSVVTGLLAALMAAIGPSTTQLVAENTTVKELPENTTTPA
jgi:hypothetical protein